MIVAVTEQFHDHEPKMYFLDTDKLNPANPVDKLLLECLPTIKGFGRVTYDARNWEEDPAWVGSGRPGLTEAAKTESGPAEKMIFLNMDFDA
jgi:hypothetical protein